MVRRRYLAVVDMVADVVAGSGAAFSDAYAAASIVVFTIYRSPTLVPEMKIPPGDVNAPCLNVESIVHPVLIWICRQSCGERPLLSIHRQAL